MDDPGTLEVVQRLEERVGRHLAERPLELVAEEHRARLAELFSRLGEMTHYELLDLPGDPGPQEIHDAFGRLARLVHPSHAVRLGLEGREKIFALLFERVAEAYLTLTDPDTRRAYDLEWGSARVEVSAERRTEDRRRAARQKYERARGLIAQESYHFAVELLKEAARLDPQPGYFALLGEAQAANPHWLRQAADSFRRALELGADDPRVRLGLARACEGLGREEEARRHYEAARTAASGADLAEVEQALGRLAGEEDERPAGGWRRFFGRG